MSRLSPDGGGWECPCLVPRHSAYDGTVHPGRDESCSSCAALVKPWPQNCPSSRMPSVSETKPCCRQNFSNRYPILKPELLPCSQSVDVLTFGKGAVEVGRVADAAPGFEADEGTAGFKGSPDAEGFGLSM